MTTYACSVKLDCWGLLVFFYKMTKDNLGFVLMASGVALSIGMLINALYIDVFEASKVAYTYWSLMGLILISGKLLVTQPKK